MHAEETGRACALGVSPSCSEPVAAGKRFLAPHALLLAGHRGSAPWHAPGGEDLPCNLSSCGHGVEIIELDGKLTFGKLPQLLVVKCQ